ncbi:MAG: hypothetical protein ABSA15_03940 [Thermoplasmata archaeon]
MPTATAPRREPIWSERVALALDIAADRAAGIPIETLVDLLPEDAPAAPEIDSWIRSHAPDRPIVDGVVYPRAAASSVEDSRERLSRATEFLRRASDAFPEPMLPSNPWLRCVAVTGSVAYGSAEREDDLDFLVVTRRGAVWFFLASLFLLRRLRPVSSNPAGPHHSCFNYVVDDAQLIRDYATPRGFLFAREALTAKVLAGEDFYRGVLGSSAWLEQEAPRLLTRWREDGGFPAPPTSERAPWPVRLLNVPLFFAVGTYLQLTGLVRNHRLVRAGLPDRSFRTTTVPGRLTYSSQLFRRLCAEYSRASVTRRWEDG